MAKTAFLFPGQGGQFVGQGQNLLDRGTFLLDLFAQAEEISGLPLKELSLKGPIAELSQTINLQPAVLTVSLALAKIAVAEGAEPVVAAGHSLGEYGALCLAEVLTERQALTLVSARAHLSQKAQMEHPGVMAAFLNISGEEVIKLCDLGSAVGPVVAANFNAPSQTVISGDAKAVAAVVRYGQLKKAKIIPLPVTGAFHSPLMAEAAAEMKKLILAVDFKKPRFPVIPNALGETVDDPGRIKELLIEQMVSPVQWVKTSAALLESDPDAIIECWPKLYVGSLVKKCLPADLKIPIQAVA
ncbi:MAG: ACP S-malonyltransferase [Deltaproteobacteria bacterium]|jgi:[acyl-carrier-protein] S-malonyltransferase|nr:ACP S-malonyltransferase [Deltaproteobacteria bacterium]